MLRRKTVLLLSTGMLCVGAYASALVAPAAHAEISACRDDPMVKLTDGSLLRLETSIHDNAADVQSVVYTVHAPQGVSLDKVTITGGELKDRVSVHLGTPDMDGAYGTDTLVTTATGNVPVTTSLVIPGGTSAVASGLSGQALHISVSG